MRKRKRKVFGIGMFRTGTTSFGEAMALLGYRARYRFIPLLDNLSAYFDLDPRQFLPFEETIRREADCFDAFADSPWLYLYRELDRWYPNSLFVLTLRKDAASVARSDLDWWERKAIMPRWLAEVGRPPTAEMLIERYERHNENVRRYFRDKASRLLQVCWETETSPWRTLCDFVGVEAPDLPFPHANCSSRSGREAESTWLESRAMSPEMTGDARPAPRPYHLRQRPAPCTRRPAMDARTRETKTRESLNDGYRDGSLLRYYRAVNETYAQCVAYTLGNRGFFAEVTTVARAMIYAWTQGRQFVLDASDFAYRCRSGWTDYFEPFCANASEVAPQRIRERFGFTPTGDCTHIRKLRAFDPGRIRFGALEIAGTQSLIRHFMRLIFHLGYDSKRQASRLKEGLHLPGDYVAIHIRRGDKIGDEDAHYPAEVYFEYLRELRDQAIFVMSDDYAAVGEVCAYLKSHERTNRVATLCRPEHAGFDIWKLRAAGRFAGGEQPFDGEEAYRRFVWEETNRLLAETVIATGAKRFVSTFASNVGRTVWYLHDEPDACRLIRSQATVESRL